MAKSWLYGRKPLSSDTEDGTPQGGIASPTFANIALDGLEIA